MSKDESGLTGKGSSLTPFVFDPRNPDSVGQHLAETTGFNLITGTMRRRNQAITNPKEYIDDKTNLWNTLLTGKSKGALAVGLPGFKDGEIPQMSSLTEEWAQTFTALISSGIPIETAKQQADIYARMMFNQRLQMFSTAFPGLVDDAYESALSAKTLQNATKAQQSGLVDVQQSSSKYAKYKKRAKKYKRNKKKKPAT
jgi:hypothetical protein